ncbi:MAG: YybH family protein [Rhodothermales bacterium]
MNVRKVFLPLFFACLTVLFVGCQSEGGEGGGEPADQETEDLEMAINEVRDQFIQAIGQGDAAAVAAVWAADATTYSPDGASATGTPEIEATFQELLDMGITSVELQPTETLTDLGNVVFELGQYTYTGQSAEGEALTLTGEYFTLLTKENDTWKILRSGAFTRGAPSSEEMAHEETPDDDM